MSNKKFRKRSRHYPELDLEENPTSSKIKAPKIESDLGLAFKINQRFTPTPRQQKFLEYALDPTTQMIFCEGPAGTTKTYYAAYVGLRLLKEKKVNEILYVRSIVESARKAMGSLPGEVGDKFRPWMKPLLEKCDELIGTHTVDDLIKRNLVRCEPVNYLRGSTFKDCVVIVDETQNLELSEIITIMTRIGTNCKMFFLGDSFQSDIFKTCFERVKNNFSDPECEAKGIRTVAYTEEDIVRSEILKFIVSRLNRLK